MTATSIAGRARITHIRRLDSMAIALTGEAATDGSVALGFNLNFSLDPGRGFDLSRQPLAQAGVGPRDRLSRPQRQWRARSGRAARKGRAGHDRHQPGRAADRRQGLGDRRRPSAPSRRSRSGSTRPASPTRCWCRRRRCRSSCRGRAFRPRSRSAWSAAAISKARSSRAAGWASKGSTSSWSMRPARSSPPRAPTSTASSCSSASPTAITRVRVAEDVRGRGQVAHRSRASRSTVTRRQVGRPAGLDPGDPPACPVRRVADAP